MIFGNLSQVLENEKTMYEAVNESLNMDKPKKQGRISRILTSLSHYGMNYSDKVLKNMQAIPADKLLKTGEDKFVEQNLYNSSSWNNWKVKPEEDKTFAEKTLSQKREILRKMAQQPELEDILDMMTNEAIVADEDEAYIGKPFLDTGLVQDLNEKSSEEIRNAMDTAFYKIYMLVEWKKYAWDQFKRFLIEGVLSKEIVYDDLEHPKSIIGIIDIDPATLTREVTPDGTTVWKQFKDQVGRERTLLDAQIIYIKYEDTGVTERQSYLERLIRPFNIYRIIEQAQVIWTVTQSSFKTKFTIPVGGMNKAKGAQTLRQAMNSYRENIKFNTDTGELMVNGSVNLPFNQEYWMPENENGTPQIETIVDNGPQLNESDQIDYFLNKLYKMSKIPGTRFDRDAQSAWFGTDPTQALRDEINFTRYVNRLRDVYSIILLKPLRIQLSLSMPDIKNDKRILDAVSIRFNSYNLFEEMMNIEVMTKRIEFIGTMKDSIVITDEEGNETPYFSPKFLVLKYLKMSDADLELNDKIKLEEKLAKKQADKQNKEEENSDKDSGGDLGGGDDNSSKEPESDESGDVDSEMLGTVKPESSETTSL